MKSKSIGNSQVLNKDYTRREEIEVVIKEMADQVATRLRRVGAKASVISLWIGFSMGYIDQTGKVVSGIVSTRFLGSFSFKMLSDTLLLLVM